MLLWGSNRQLTSLQALLEFPRFLTMLTLQSPDSTTGTVQFQSPPTISYESSTITIESTPVPAEEILDIEVQPEAQVLEESYNTVEADTGVYIWGVKSRKRFKKGRVRRSCRF
jgi:hypothetical protein